MRLLAWSTAILLWGAAPIQAATFTVNLKTDFVDFNPGDGLCDFSVRPGEQCTLRAAIMETNALAGADTINLPVGTYLLSIAGTGENSAATGDLDITDDLTLNGSSPDTTIIDGGFLDGVFHIPGAGTTVDVADVTIQRGLRGISSHGLTTWPGRRDRQSGGGDYGRSGPGDSRYRMVRQPVPVPRHP